MHKVVSSPMSNANQSKRNGKAANSSQSLNHLLNFTLPPRQTHTARRTTKKPTGYGARNTDRFVNAQYRFVVKPSGDYTVHFADPDIFFQWEDILQVILPPKSPIAGSYRDDDDLTTCPICLSPPTAPRMTRCGHIFCYPCILHYLNTSEVGKWVRCPICFDSVGEKQLKSVKWFDDPSSSQGSSGEQLNELDYELDLSSSSKVRRSLRMRLMCRPQITTLALPCSSTWPSELMSPHQAPFHFLPDIFTFSRFMLATSICVIADLTKDLDQLKAERRLLESMNDELGIVFVDSAMAKVQLEMSNAQAMDTETVQYAVERAHRGLRDIQRREAYRKDLALRDPRALQPPNDVPEELLALDSKAGTEHESREIGGRPPKQRRNVNPPPPTTSSFYYYQAACGSPIFLHPLDNRILLSHFHSYASFPDEITVEVENFSEGSVNDDLRKRCRYLALPEGANVAFIETDLEPIVGAEALKNFEGALKTRRTKRKEKVRKDDRAKMRAEEKEREKVYGNPLQWGAFGGYAPNKIPDDLSTARPTVEAQEEVDTESFPAVQQEQSLGAWGSRSFASALHGQPSAQPAQRRHEREEGREDEWDVDLAWHEMQQRGGGKRKQGRGQKLVILGGGSSGARRR